MIRITRALVVAGAAALALTAAAAPPEYVVFPASCGDVVFPHHVHHGISRACSGCHVTGKRPGLHGNPALASATLKERAHAFCVACHRSVRQVAATVKCLGCHRHEPPPANARFAPRGDAQATAAPPPAPAAGVAPAAVARTTE